MRPTLPAAAALALTALSAAADPARPVTYHTLEVEGVPVFYREDGPADAPVLLLLHGFPSSSHMFRDLIPELADSFHIIAPDYPGFGQSGAPVRADFETLAQTMTALTEELGLTSYTLYMQDYGGPVGMRMAVQHPDRINGLIFQNATIHVEGWSPDVVAQFAPFWAERTPETEAPLRQILTAETTRWQYEHGSTRTERLSPDAWLSDQAGLDRPSNDAIQLDYLWSYQDNVASYPAWQDYLAAERPRTLIVWGKNDPFFTMNAVTGLQNLLPNAETRLYEAGHFALETHTPEIAASIREVMAR
ncbi:alpha/beta fold hydrolase [Donghicola mangrovi]|uniref:Alpha/beta hydrolase n=1 Tax=Donghicola mangrovi TaxID=2729614 RepID=A0A850Q8I8_9RHOB|nr:alpha/beta hydrolase [Donghicola mangrovi]NVO25263.1 alpha/beta hydrolase [Donghicola mangrovi]